MLLGLCTAPMGGQETSEPLKIVGFAVEVTPTRLTILGKDGTEVRLATQEDYSVRLAVGSDVTAWYYLKDGRSVLDRLEYLAEKLSSPAPQSHSGIKRIILLPNSSVADADGLFDAIEEYVESTFRWRVAPRVLAVEMRNRAGKSVSALEAIDPSTGQFDMSRYLKDQPNLVVKIASETRVDAVLEVNVEQVMAKVHRMIAAWDGVEEPVAGKGSRLFAKFTIVPIRGEVAASTVDLKLWDAKGQLLWSKRRGFAVLGIAGKGRQVQYRPLPEYLQDSTKVHEWLGTAFDSLRPGAGS